MIDVAFTFSICYYYHHLIIAVGVPVGNIIFLLFFCVYVCALCAVISELIHYTTAGNIDGVSANMPLIQVIVPQVMNLKVQLGDSTKVKTF